MPKDWEMATEEGMGQIMTQRQRTKDVTDQREPCSFLSPESRV